MPRPRRLLVLALDAASPDLLRRWGREGTLPAVGGLLARGRHAPTRSVEGVYVGATWPSFTMGRGPGDHGLYWLDRILPGTYRSQRAGPEELSPFPALWDRVGEAGGRVVVLDVPLVAASSTLPGLHVVEWGVHDAVFGFSTHPPALAGEIEARHGRHPAPAHCDASRTPSEARAFAGLLAAGAAARAQLTLDLLDREPEWTLAIQAFSETHCAGHQLWHTHDPAHPAHDPAGPDLVREVYRAVDAAVGRIVEGLGPDTTVALVALHGMGPAGGHSLLLREVLLRLGVEVPDGAGDGAPGAADRGSEDSPPGRGEGAPRGGLGARVSAVARGAYRALVPERMRGRVYELRQRRNQARGVGSPLDLDPGRTRAFAVGLGTGAPFSAIRLNLRGREPRGTLEPGAEADAFVEELIGELEALVDPRTGARAVTRVLHSRDLFPGPRAHHLPDLLVEWAMTPPRGTTAAGGGREAVWEVESPRLGRLSVTNHYCRTGEHRPEGLVAVAGPGIEPGAVDRTLSILELAPTFAALLGVATPDMPAGPAAEFISPDAGPAPS